MVAKSFWLGKSKLQAEQKHDAEQRPTRIPLSIYVMWHPSFKDGAVLAREVRDWFSGSAIDVRSSGLGIPVHFRSADWTKDYALTDADVPPPVTAGSGPRADRTRRKDRWRRPIALDDAIHNIFVPIVDDHMVDDPSWRRDLLELADLHHKSRLADGRPDPDQATEPPLVHLAPFQVTSAWPRMPADVSRIKALYLRRWNERDDDDDRLDVWRVRLRRLLTQALVRLLADLRASALPTEIFLSHAKVDLALGPGVAERLRDVAAGYGQIEVFYDENDLPSGIDWRGRMLGAARTGAGIIAVLSDRYATRYWCRREIQVARTPARVEKTDETKDDWHIWTVRPTVVAVTLARDWSRLVGDLGTAPAIRWQQDESDQGPAILDQLFREALVTEFQLLYARMLCERLRQVTRDLPMPAPVAFITWTPDAATLMRLNKQLDDEWRQAGLLVYPGHGFMPTEERDLDRSLGKQVQFRSYEELADLLQAKPAPTWKRLTDVVPAASVPREPGPRVQLSAGDADDLDVLGYDQPQKPDEDSRHVDVVAFRLCRAVFTAGGRIAYGGILRRSTSFTALLHDTVAATVPEPSPDATVQEPVVEDPDPETPLENWVAQPYRDRYPIATQAAMAGLCRFYFVGKPVPPYATGPERAVAVADALSDMRRELAANTRVTIGLAGKRWGFEGILPGVAEEILCATESAGALEVAASSARVILLGEYGGIAREMVRFILDRTTKVPAPLTFAGQLDHADARFMALLDGGDDVRRRVEQRYRDLETCLKCLRGIARQGKDLDQLGLTVAEWKGIMTSTSIGHVRRLIATKVIPRLRKRTEAIRPPRPPPAKRGRQRAPARRR